MKIKNILILGAAVVALTSCDDLFEPAIENNQDISAMYKDADFARGLLDNAFIALPYEAMPASDLATDDAVSNDPDNSYKRMATGGWTSNMNPVTQWDARYHAIQYCNILIENATKVPWANDAQTNELFVRNYLGNAYALRGLHHFFILRAHAGAASEGGEIMGIPMHMEFKDASSDFNEERLSFKECYEKIMGDWDKAMTYLPEDYGNIEEASQIPDKFKDVATNITSYNRAFGTHFRGRVTSNIITAFKAQLALLAASPAYAKAGAATYQKAAELAAECMAKFGGITKIQQDGWKIFTNNKYLTSFSGMDDNPAEIIWRANVNTTQSFEKDNYPPSLGGSGRVNPTQNLVDAFPMVDGWPIDDPNALVPYDPQDPYAGRDPRLTEFILVNGDAIGSGGSAINTESDAKDPADPSKLNHDGLNHEVGKSTITGYYLRKHLRNDINLNGETGENHLQLRIRTTEILLAYAEAANAVNGPDAKIGIATYTPREVIKALRDRAGVGTDYIDQEAAKGKEAFAKVIQNERRIELCFENSRFWDLRRWMLPLNETAKGMKITTEGGVKKYEVIDVEKRDYKNYMIYGPLPYSEVVKWSNLTQNWGW